MALRIALSVFFLRLCVKKWQRRVVLITLALSASFSVLIFFFVVFQCGVYDSTTTFLLRRLGGKCASDAFALGMAYTHAIITTMTVSFPPTFLATSNINQGWIFLVLPVFILKGSLMKKNEKRIVFGILMFASM